MLDFKPLCLDDLPRLRPYFKYSGSRICDTTPGAVFLWRELFRTEWAIYDGSLYFKVNYPGKGDTFPMHWEAAGRSITGRLRSIADGGI